MISSNNIFWPPIREPVTHLPLDDEAELAGKVMVASQTGYAWTRRQSSSQWPVVIVALIAGTALAILWNPLWFPVSLLLLAITGSAVGKIVFQRATYRFDHESLIKAIDSISQPALLGHLVLLRRFGTWEKHVRPKILDLLKRSDDPELVGLITYCLRFPDTWAIAEQKLNELLPRTTPEMVRKFTEMEQRGLAAGLSHYALALGRLKPTPIVFNLIRAVGMTSYQPARQVLTSIFNGSVNSLLTTAEVRDAARAALEHLSQNLRESDSDRQLLRRAAEPAQDPNELLRIAPNDEESNMQ